MRQSVYKCLLKRLLDAPQSKLDHLRIVAYDHTNVLDGILLHAAQLYTNYHRQLTGELCVVQIHTLSAMCWWSLHHFVDAFLVRCASTMTTLEISYYILQRLLAPTSLAAQISENGVVKDLLDAQNLKMKGGIEGFVAPFQTM